MSQAAEVERLCRDSNTPVVCYPRNCDSVAFYLKRDDLRSYRSKETILEIASLSTKMEVGLAILLDLDDLNSSIQGDGNPRETSITEFKRVTSITELVSFHAFGQPSHDRGNAGSVG